MKSLSSPNDPVISRRINYQMLIGVLIGFSLGYGAVLAAAVIAKELLK